MSEVYIVQKQLYHRNEAFVYMYYALDKENWSYQL